MKAIVLTKKRILEPKLHFTFFFLIRTLRKDIDKDSLNKIATYIVIDANILSF